PTDTSRANLHKRAHRSLPIQQEGGGGTALTLKPTRNKAIYVQRLGFVGLGQGGHAGERLLVEAMPRAGVAILDPGKETLMRQMALYAGARLVIFAEGSAMHGRQLLGRVDQKILVLRRRPQSRMAWAQLEPRCRKLKYALIIKAFAMPLPPQGVPVHPYGIAFYNKDPLLNTLRRNGIDITPYWDEEAYRQAMKVDAHAWYRGVMRRRIIHRKKTLAHIRTAFDTAGIPVPS
ncbi:glycosyltransferase family 61 protein, partial [Paracoccus versutus]|uniref:glycosyltransferase 61 family protein n=1 Tax=Paracoccus versutus TaxID=34007 RepID=UPI001FB75C05